MFRKYPETESSLEQTSLRCLKFPQVLHSETQCCIISVFGEFKYKNAIDATLELLNRYGASFGVTVERDGDLIRFTTPVFDSSGKQLQKPKDETYSIENIKSGETLNALLEAFISNYSAPQFINNAYRTGKGVAWTAHS